MPLLLDTTPADAAAIELRSRNCIEVGLVNNMPDAALEATERQFVALIRAASTDAVVRLRLYALPDVPRGDRGRLEMASRYRDVSELWDSRLDGLIVTGTEPRAADLREEPYWPTLAKLVDWARDNTASAIWSCLAAHAAVLHADGIERRPLAQKQFGVFDCRVTQAHPLTKGTGTRLRVPHSRCNDLPEAALASAGYRLLTRSVAAGVDAFTRAEKSCQFVFFQGHPEYEGDTLLREYRRDVGRFLRGEREHYPAAPEGYFDDAAAAAASVFRAQAQDDRREEMLTDFPMRALEAGIEGAWHRSAVRIYENWLRELKARAEQRKAAIAIARPRQNGWRSGGMRFAVD
jgi:homoserine O-succinyltransferase/O-acetyltransferase